jgi:hypothetical protein
MIVLTRIEATRDGTFGQLVVPLHQGLYLAKGLDRGELVTVEDDWLGNKRGVSCIPDGNYILRRSWYFKRGFEVFEVTGRDLAGRLRVLVHPGNTEEDTEACILPGLRFGPLPVYDEDDPKKRRVIKKAALASRQAFHRWMDWLAEADKVPLSIRWAAGVKPLDTVVL